MVHREKSERDTEISELRVLRDVPFQTIPTTLIEMLSERSFTVDEFRCYGWWANTNYWNIVFIDKEYRIRAACWGYVDIIENFVHVLRLTADPALWKTDGEFLKRVADELRKAFGSKRIFFISKRWKAFLRKASECGKVYNECRVIEVNG